MSKEAQRHNKPHNASEKADPTSGLSKEQRHLLMWILTEEKRILTTATAKAADQLAKHGVPFGEGTRRRYMSEMKASGMNAVAQSLARRVHKLKELGLITFKGKQAQDLKLTTIGRAEAERLAGTGGLTSREAKQHQIIDTPSGPFVIEAGPPFYRAKKRAAHEAINSLTAQLQGWEAARAAALPIAEGLGDHPAVDYLRATFELEISHLQGELTEQEAELERWSGEYGEDTEQLLLALEMRDELKRVTPARRAEVLAALPPEHFEILERAEQAMTEKAPQLQRILQEIEEKGIEKLVEEFQQWESPREAKVRQRRELRDEAVHRGWIPPEE